MSAVVIYEGLIAHARGFAGTLEYGCSVRFDALAAFVAASRYSVSDPDSSWAFPRRILLTTVSQSFLNVGTSSSGMPHNSTSLTR